MVLPLSLFFLWRLGGYMPITVVEMTFSILHHSGDEMRPHLQMSSL